jgi:REP element-mobilizing transposase RayT
MRLARILLCAAAMLPRPVFAGETVMITRRCTQRQFLLRPDDETHDIYLYALGLAAEKYGVDLIYAMVMSNHHHLHGHDREGDRAEFYRYLHALVARATNFALGRFENFWDSNQTSVVRLVSVDDLIEKIVYAATNPVAAGLVARVDQWPGVNTIKALLDKQPIVVKRPWRFFSEDMPDEVTLHFRIPPEYGDQDVILARIRARIAEVEAEHAAARAATGAAVLGRRAVRLQSWRDRPRTFEPRFGISPQVACRDKWRRVEALARNRLFVTAYVAARELWKAGRATLFPPGTYWLARHAFVPVAEPPKI